MNRNQFWLKMHHIPIQTDFLDVEEVNPADAFRKQAESINAAGPLYAELESLENRLNRVASTLKELRSRILAQNMPLSSTATRTTDLVDAFVLSAAETYRDKGGNMRDISETLAKMDRLKNTLELRVSQTTRRLRAIENMADKCDRILNWAKHEARLEFKS